jgi:multiple sugar transport system ATP-binding protein
MSDIRLEKISKTYAGGHHAVRAIDLAIADGELMVLVGPSGCGKSTLLRLIAGLETPTAGSVRIGDRDVTTLPPQERDVAMVFQTYALYPHKTVRGNLAFPLRMRGATPTAIAERVARVADVLGLTPLLDRKPRQLSGGQRQRVALGRAMVREPQAFLLDEPLSNLDATLRVQTRAELARMHRRLGTTMVYVTHDQEEAMTLGHRVAVMHQGSVQQVAPPMELYHRPASVFVAGFIGSPAMNLFPCVVKGLWLECRGFAIPLERPLPPGTPAELMLGVRPSDITFVPPADGQALGKLEVLEPLGDQALMHVVLAGAPDSDPLRIIGPVEPRFTEGEPVGLTFRRERLHLFERGTGTRVAD